MMSIMNCLIFYIVCILFMIIGAKVQLSSLKNKTKENTKQQKNFIQMGGMFCKLYRAY